jgi:putative transposase
MGKRHTAEEIVAKLRQVEVLCGQGKALADAIRAIGVTEVTYYRWRNEYGGLKGDQVKRLKELEAENARLRRAVSDLTLDKQILRESDAGKLLVTMFSSRRYWRARGGRCASQRFNVM